jgi:hypothetical protein
MGPEAGVAEAAAVVTGFGAEAEAVATGAFVVAVDGCA